MLSLVERAIRGGLKRAGQRKKWRRRRCKKICHKVCRRIKFMVRFKGARIGWKALSNRFGPARAKKIWNSRKKLKG